MNTLYIIGNGFDLHHQVKSNYHDFKKYLEQNHSELLEIMGNYYDISNDSMLWWQFENGLKDFDSSELESEFAEHLPNYASDDFRDRDRYDLEIYIENELSPFRKELQIAFNNWILSLEQPLIRKKIAFDNNSFFLTFNHTDTLERIYNIKRDQILYIHNKSENNGNDLIFGHSWSPGEWAKQRETKMPEGLTEEEQDSWRQEQADHYDYSIMRGYEAIDFFFTSIYKDCRTIIESNKAFFKALKNIRCINIIGHSLSIVDKPYFEEVIKHIDKDNSKWMASYYSNNDKVKHLEFIHSLGIDFNCITIYKLPEVKRPIQTTFF